jgi:hypothetical protein
MPRRLALGVFLTFVALGAVVACSSSIQYPGELVGSFDITLIPDSNGCTQFSLLPGFCPENGSPGPCSDGGYPDGGTTVLVVSSGTGDAGYISYQSGSQSATASGTWDGQTVVTAAVAQRLFILANQPSADAGCIAAVTETIHLTLYSSLDGGCDGGIPVGPPPSQVGGVWQTQTSPACGILVDNVVPDSTGLCCPDPLTDGGCGTPVLPSCVVSFGLVGQGRASPP